MRMGFWIFLLPSVALGDFEVWKSKDGKPADLELVDVTEDKGERTAEFLTRGGKKVVLKNSDLDASGQERLAAWKPVAIRFHRIDEGKESGGLSLNYIFVVSGTNFVGVKPGSVVLEIFKLGDGQNLARSVSCRMNAEAVNTTGSEGRLVTFEWGGAGGGAGKAEISGRATVVTATKEVTGSVELAIGQPKGGGSVESQKAEIGPYKVWLSKLGPFTGGKFGIILHVLDSRNPGQRKGDGASPSDPTKPRKPDPSGAMNTGLYEIVSAELTGSDKVPIGINWSGLNSYIVDIPGEKVTVTLKYMTALKERAVTFKKAPDDTGAAG